MNFYLHFGLAVLCFHASHGFDSFKAIQPTNGMYKGYFGRTEICPYSNYVTGFQLKSDGVVSKSSESGFFTDDQAATGIRFFCDSKNFGISSAVGEKGEWYPPQFCPKGHKVSGFQLNVNSHFVLFDKVNDELGVEDVRLVCSDGTILTGLVEKEPKEVNLRKDDDETPSNEFFVCGLQTRIDDSGILSDTAGMTNLIAICCK